MFVSPPQPFCDAFRKTTRGLLPAVAVLGALSLSPAVGAEEYDLDIDRVLTAGERYAIECESYNNLEVVQVFGDEQPIEEITSSEVNLEGEMEILAVDDEGDVTQLAIRVARYDIEINDEGIELDTDHRIIATADGDAVAYTYEDGSALDEAVVALLDELFSDMISKEGDDEESEENARMFGIDEPRSPGEKWELDIAAFLEAFGDDDGGLLLGADAEVEDQEAHFVKLDTRAFGEEVAVLEIELAVAGFAFTPGVFPDFIEIGESELEFTGEVWTPLDATSGQAREEFAMEMSYRAAGVLPDEKIEIVVEAQVDAGQTVVLYRIED